MAIVKKIMIWIPLGAITLIVIGVWISCMFFASPVYEGKLSDHFDGGQFHNRQHIERDGFGRFLKWMINRTPGVWNEWTDSKFGLRPPERIFGDDLIVTFVNHSTVLIQTGGLNILTDPVWSDRIGPVSWAGPKRHRAPGIKFEDLPPIDAVVISHNHYDHMDIPTIIKLEAAFSPNFYTGLGNLWSLKNAGVKKIKELDWWDSIEENNGVRITFVPAEHFSARSVCDRNRTLWGGFVISTPSGSIYFAGDTGMGPHINEIREKFGPVRIAMLPIGAFLPRWFMGPVHLSPNEAVEAHKMLGARASIPIHYGTFRLGDDGEYDAIDSLKKAIADSGESGKSFQILNFGEGRKF